MGYGLPYIFSHAKINNNKLAFEHTLTRVLRGSSIFWVKINLENLLYFGITTFSNYKKKLRGVMSIMCGEGIFVMSVMHEEMLMILIFGTNV